MKIARIHAALLFFTIFCSAEDQVATWLKSDSDTDGKLTESETTGLMKQFFKRNDTNKDGFLDEDELSALAKRFGERAKQKSRQAAKGDRRNTQNAETPDGVTFEKDISYREGNPMWTLDLAYPTVKSDSLRPGLVIVHGGGWRSGDKGGGIWRNLPLEYAADGYVAISINYRLTGEAPFPACVEDVKCAVRWLRAHADQYQLDPQRIGAYGNSAGAHLVSMLGLVGPDAGLEGDGPFQDISSGVQAVCASAIPTDFTNWTIRGLLAGPEKTLAERAARASPVTYVTKESPPFLLMHGKEDRTVPFSQGEALVEKLRAAGHPVTFMTFDEGGHGIFNQYSDDTKPAMKAFFDKVLRPQSKNSLKED